MLCLTRILFSRSSTTARLTKNSIGNPINIRTRSNTPLGWSKDPLVSLKFKDTFKYEVPNGADICDDFDKKIIRKIIEAGRNPNFDDRETTCYHLGEEYLNVLFEKSMDFERSNTLNKKIDQILEYRFNFNPLYTNSPRVISQVRDSSNIFDAIGDRVRHSQVCDNASFTVPKQSQFSQLYDISQPYISFPVFSDYVAIRRLSAFHVKSSIFILKLFGRNSDYFLNQILSSSVSHMAVDDVYYSCLLDSKAVVIDTCFVIKHPDGYVLVTTGNKTKEVFDYIGSYVVHVRGFGLDVTMTPLDDRKVCTLYGPLSIEALNDLLRNDDAGLKICEPEPLGGTTGSTNLNYFMRCFDLKFRDNTETITCYRVSDVEDGFEFIVPDAYFEDFTRLLLSHKSVEAIGPEAYDIARLEGGVIRPDVDLTPDSTPMHCSLMWNVDVQKVRNKQVFAHKQFGSNMVQGVSKVRVGLISNKMLDPSCTVLTRATRMPIGLITSCAFSPALGMYISHCYVNSDYAKHDTPVIISVPEAPDESVSKSRYKRYYRNHTLKTFCGGTLVRLPFVKPSFRTSSLRSTQSKANVTYLKTKDQKVSAKEVVVKEQPRDLVKTKKQLWKDIIKRHRKRLHGTLDMACAKWENVGEEPVCDVEERGSEHIVAPGRITIASTGASLAEVLDDYRKRHDLEVGRHRRYRPPSTQPL